MQSAVQEVSKSTVVVRPANASDAEQISIFLAENMGRNLPGDLYRNLFTYSWYPERPHYGYVAFDGDRIVGYYGAVYAQRAIDRRTLTFCNMTNWCVLPEFRIHSMKLLFGLLKGKVDCFTNLSPTPEVQPFFERLGFERLNTFKWFAPLFAQGFGLFRRFACRVFVDYDEVQSRLSGTELQIFEDHQGIGCRHMVLTSGAEQCYVVSKRRTRKGLRFSEILYCSSPELLRKYFEIFKVEILVRDRTMLVAVDEHLYGGRPLISMRYRRVTLFKSAAVKAEQIDNLYSEIALL